MRDESIYKEKIKDARAVYFTQENYGVEGDGVTDVSHKLQQAVNHVVEAYGYGIVFVPQGKYLLSRTIYVPKAVRIIGYGARRPEFILADYAEGFQHPIPEDKGGYRYLFWFVNRIVTDETKVEDSNPGTFYSAMSNINIRLGQGNHYAVALRTHYAQHAFLSHMRIDVMSGMAGIYDVGNEMENISIYGGVHAIITTKCSPGWPFFMVDTYFENQRVSAIKTHEAGLTIVRNKTVHTPKFIDVDENYFEKIYVEDSVFEKISDSLLDVAMDENSLTQIHLKNVVCKDITILARYKDSGRTTMLDRNGILCYTHGTVIRDDVPERKIVDQVIFLSEQFDEDVLLKSDIKALPEMQQWVDVTELGLVGDGKTDNSVKMKAAVEAHSVLYFPQGEYLFTERILLKEDTVLLGLHPFGTRLILKDNSESFTGMGSVKGFLETPENARNIINGIGIETGGKNPRATALLWRAGEESYVNDVKLIGGHGNLVKGTGAFENPYNESRTADANRERMWDAQYPSFLVKGGGGIFKDIWSASPYATSGFEVQNSRIPSKVYCMSLEHHQRNELRLNNVTGWDFYAIQTEEEFAEGEYALPMELIQCENIGFHMAYFFRTIFVKTPLDYCVKCYHCKNIEFHNVHNNSQMKYTITGFLKDQSQNREIRLWQAAKAVIQGQEQKKVNHIREEVVLDEKQVNVTKPVIEKVFEGFRFADGGITDSRGNFYFVDSLDKRVYAIDGESGALTMVMESPLKINSIAVDTEDHLIFIGEYVIPKGATKNGMLQTNVLPPDSYGTSYGFWYNREAVIVAFTEQDGEMVPMEKVKIGSIQPELVYYPGNRWRDGADFSQVLQYNPEWAFLAPDGKTILPCHYDFIRANHLAKAVPGGKLYSVDELYKRVYECEVLESGLLGNPKVVAEQGDFCTLKADAKLYVCDDNIKIYDKDNRLIHIVKLPERATTIGMDLSGQNIKYITTRNKVYLIKSKDSIK